MTNETLWFLLGVLSGTMSGYLIASVRSKEVVCEELVEEDND